MTHCRFYGHDGQFGALIASHGNQCALVRESYSPCRMEIERRPVDETTCPLVAAVAHLCAELATPATLSPAERAEKLLSTMSRWEDGLHPAARPRPPQ